MPSTSSSSAKLKARSQKCKCDKLCNILMTKTNVNGNEGREFYKCSKGTCNFFKWCDEDDADADDGGSDLVVDSLEKLQKQKSQTQVMLMMAKLQKEVACLQDELSMLRATRATVMELQQKSQKEGRVSLLLGIVIFLLGMLIGNFFLVFLSIIVTS